MYHLFTRYYRLVSISSFCLMFCPRESLPPLRFPLHDLVIMLTIGWTLRNTVWLRYIGLPGLQY